MARATLPAPNPPCNATPRSAGAPSAADQPVGLSMGAVSPTLRLLSVFFLTHSPSPVMYIYAETGTEGLPGLAQSPTMTLAGPKTDSMTRAASIASQLMTVFSELGAVFSSPKVLPGPQNTLVCLCRNNCPWTDFQSHFGQKQPLPASAPSPFRAPTTPLGPLSAPIFLKIIPP